MIDFRQTVIRCVGKKRTSFSHWGLIEIDDPPFLANFPEGYEFDASDIRPGAIIWLKEKAA